MTGKFLDEKLGQIHFWVMFIGFNITFFPMHFLGMDGMPRRIHTYESAMGWDMWNLVSTAGSLIIGLSALMFLHIVFKSIRKGKIAGNDPWDARTLEWSIPSPPPEYNFKVIPPVHSRDAWWETKNGDGAVLDHGNLVDATESEEDGHHGIHMPGLSYYPLLVAAGLTLGGYGVVFADSVTWAMAAIGGIIAMMGVYAWSFEPASEPQMDEDSKQH